MSSVSAWVRLRDQAVEQLGILQAQPQQVGVQGDSVTQHRLEELMRLIHQYEWEIRMRGGEPATELTPAEPAESPEEE